MSAWLAATLVAPLASAQDQPPPPEGYVRDGDLVMHVGPGEDGAPRFSLGAAEVEDTRVTIRQRREMAPECQWPERPDLETTISEVIPVRAQEPSRTPEEFGVLYATMYSALMAANGGDPTPLEHGCVRVIMTAMARAAQGETEE